jgi:hypothetical protein
MIYCCNVGKPLFSRGPQLKATIWGKSCKRCLSTFRIFASWSRVGCGHYSQVILCDTKGPNTSTSILITVLKIFAISYIFSRDIYISLSNKTLSRSAELSRRTRAYTWQWSVDKPSLCISISTVKSKKSMKEINGQSGRPPSGRPTTLGFCRAIVSSLVTFGFSSRYKAENKLCQTNDPT